MAGPSAERMYLVDAHSLIFQVFHAIGEMSSPTGLPVNALFGFARDMLFLRQEAGLPRLRFDRGRADRPHQVYKEYKAHRAPMPDDLCRRCRSSSSFVEAMHIPVVTAPGYEADDAIATVARAASQRGIDVFICTSDKDCRQLIDDRVRLYSLRKHAEFGRDELLKDWGITPEQVVDFQSLVGDKVDNVPGVPGIGEKTAAALLQQFGTLDNILANVGPGAGGEETREPAGLGGQGTNQPDSSFAWKPMSPFRWIGTAGAFSRGTRSDCSACSAIGASATSPPRCERKPRRRSRLRSRMNRASCSPSAPMPRRTAPLAGQRITCRRTRANAKPQATYHLIDTPAKFRSFFKELQRQSASPSIWKRRRSIRWRRRLSALRSRGRKARRTIWRCAARRERRRSTRRTRSSSCGRAG